MRTLPEWVGKTDDAAIPDRVLLRIFERNLGRCAECGRKLHIGHWECDHIVALVNGGEHREKNLQPLCDVPCHEKKTGRDVATKSANYQVRAKHIGLKRSRTPMPFGRKSPFKRKMNGEIVRR